MLCYVFSNLNVTVKTHQYSAIVLHLHLEPKISKYMPLKLNIVLNFKDWMKYWLMIRTWQNDILHVNNYNSLCSKYKQYKVYDMRTKYRMATTDRIWY